MRKEKNRLGLFDVLLVKKETRWLNVFDETLERGRRATRASSGLGDYTIQVMHLIGCVRFFIIKSWLGLHISPVSKNFVLISFIY